VIITDIRMPRLNGLDAIEYFQREYPHVPVIVATGFPELDLAVQLMKQGGSEYLVQPVEREKLLNAVTDAFAHRRIHWFS
jgi:two-component system chemotaxis response regulator CheY